MTRRNKQQIHKRRRRINHGATKGKLPLEAKKSADQRAYEASSTGRRLGQWDAPALSPTNAITTELQSIQRRNRASIRNNPWIARALQADTSNEIGTGIVPRAQTDDKEFNKTLMDLWNISHPLADASGSLGVYGLQWAASRARKESGECFIRIIRKRSDIDLPVPLQFQLLESDFCPIDLNQDVKGKNKIVSGIELDKYGKPVAYWMYPVHPDEGGGRSYNDMVRVPAKDIIHHFIPKRPGQLRGEPKGTQSMVRAYVFDKYDDAELGRKESRAHFTGVIRRPESTPDDYKYDPISGDLIDKDDDDLPMIEMETGTFPNLLPGEDITLFEGDDAGRGYKDYQTYQLLGIAAGWDIPYQLLSGDYTGINDRLWRAIMNQYHREVEQTQDLFVIAQICRVMWNEFVNRAIMSGVVKLPSNLKGNKYNYLKALHRPQAWKHIHPQQDVDSKIKEIEAGLSSRQKVVDETKSESVEEIDEQRSDDNKREESLGLNVVVNNDNGDKKDEQQKPVKPTK